MAYNFNPQLPEPFKCIHPLQLNKVKRFLDFQFPKAVRYIILFGSSVKLTCSTWSDLDFYIIHEELDDEENDELINEMHQHKRRLSLPCDFLYATLDEFRQLYKQKGNVEYDAYNEGVFIYG